MYPFFFTVTVMVVFVVVSVVKNVVDVVVVFIVVVVVSVVVSVVVFIATFVFLPSRWHCQRVIKLRADVCRAVVTAYAFPLPPPCRFCFFFGSDSDLGSFSCNQIAVIGLAMVVEMKRGWGNSRSECGRSCEVDHE